MYIGWQFFLYFQWAIGKTGTFIPKPPSVEAFLPLSALLAAKRLFMTGAWDPIHPAGLTLFLAFVCMALLFRKGFCGYICPVGFASSLVERIGRRLRLSREMPRWISLPLSLIKYYLLFRFCSALLRMGLQEISAFLNAPYNFVADAKMLVLFIAPSNTTLTVLGALTALSLVFRNAWCRFLCPYGAFLGLIALISPLAITRDAKICVDCKRCSRACPAGIAVHRKRRVLSPDCIGCAACTEACPVPNCVTARLGTRRVPFWTIAAGCLALLAGFYLWAVITGHWTSTIPPVMLRRFHMMQFGM